MDQMKRLKAETGQKYGEYKAVQSDFGCTGCIAECKPELCNELPLCSSDKNSVIFKTNN